MKEKKGKIFNQQEVEAIIAGNKTMFREVVKPQPILSPDKSYWEFKGIRWAGENSSYAKKFGDIAKPEMPEFARFQVGQEIRPTSRSIHLQLKLFNTNLRIKSVKVEKLAGISEEDAIAEGATSRPNCSGYRNQYAGWSMDWSRVGQLSKYTLSGTGKLTESDICLGYPKYAFSNHWNSTHKKQEHKWEANPWVFVYEFEVINNLTKK